VARLGGDEFAVLVDHVHAENEAARVAERIIAVFAEPFALERRAVDVSASVGVVASSSDVDAAEILRDADIAMYRAKASGKNQYLVFAESMREEVADRLGIRREFERALVDGQVVVHYQPIVQLETGLVTRLEALSRWQHPTRGTLIAESFVPLLEALGTISQLDRWVLRGGLPPHGRVERALSHDSHQRRSQHLGSTPQGKAAAGQGCERRARRLGARSCSDRDRGHRERLGRRRGRCAGGSRVGQAPRCWHCARRLRPRVLVSLVPSRLPGHCLKIDQVFVQSLDDPKADTRLTRAIVQLAAALGLEVVAEGIETPAQLELVRELGCDLGQGFLFSQAIDAAAVGDLLRERDAGRLSKVISVPVDVWSRRQAG